MNDNAHLTPSDLLNDLMLDIHVEVGRTKIKISELLNLGKDSILKLDEDSEAPLIIYANEKPIYKGQIISSKGKYHIRIL